MLSTMRTLTITLALGILLALSGCRPASVKEGRRGVYFWRTTFALNDAERDFLDRHKVDMMYVRYFDVVMGNDGKPVPNATIKIAHSVPAGVEIVPTVFIVNDCVKPGFDSLATRLVDRVLQMNETHNIKGVNELQIDCDWTAGTQQEYFKFLGAVKQRLEERNMTLSVTIRLHQLAMDAPPAHYGVLMVYNTGHLKDSKQRNPIIDEQDVLPYLSRLAEYDLPLCAAYPNFGWNLLFTGDKFRDILYSEDLNDTTLYRKTDSCKWVVKNSIDLPNYLSSNSSFTYLNAGDTVMQVKPSAATIVKVHDAMVHKRPGINNRVIIYSLNNNSINNLSGEIYEKIYSP